MVTKSRIKVMPCGSDAVPYQNNSKHGAGFVVARLHLQWITTEPALKREASRLRIGLIYSKFTM
jgi:hypothetical protein